MNSKKVLLGAAVSAALLFAAPMASACSLSAWSASSGTPVAGDPTDATPVARYAGNCGLLVDSVGDFLTDETPAGEASYIAQFYYYTGNRTGGSADLFQARSASGATNLPIRVQHDGTNLIFSANGSATTRTVAVTDNRWYSILLEWTAGTPGQLDITVIGAGSLTPLNTPAITGLSNASDTIEEARLGLVTGSGSGAVNFDAFDSRRTTVPARLCVGDAVLDGTRNVFDVAAIIGEINATSLSTGQPDANEDGNLDVFDLGALVPLINTTPACP